MPIVIDIINEGVLNETNRQYDINTKNKKTIKYPITENDIDILLESEGYYHTLSEALVYFF